MNHLILNENPNRMRLKGTITTTGEIQEYQFEYFPDPSVSGEKELIAQLPLTDHPFIHLHTFADSSGIAGQWRPDSGPCKQLIGDWAPPSEINLSHSAPVVCFFDGSDRNVLTVAVSETSRDVHFLTGVHEETGQMNLHIIIHLSEPVSAGRLTVRFDFRKLPFHRVLQEVVGWWDSILPDAPMEVPSCARLPMYSTWYSYHQDMQAEIMEKEYQEAARMGMRAVLIDDGWQTADNNRGYRFCGDWHPYSGKFPDFTQHIQNIHQLGMKCILWFSVPFMGESSEMWDTFKDMLLHHDSVLQTGILDPRYPQVRDYLISTYQNAARKWGLDGFKLDFIDSFRSYPDTPAWNEDMDFHEIQDAVYCLMLKIRQTLKKENPDLLIEFRQNYIGPQMRRFGNMFRVNDCPMSGITNRVAIADLRLLSGSTAVHSDMVMWPAEESPENVAIQLINCIFATLQISVRLAGLSEKQKKTLKHYLRFSIDYQDILLTGNFSVRNPLAQYPLISASKNNIHITGLYDSLQILDIPDSAWKEYWLLNGTTSDTLHLLFPQQPQEGVLTVFDCCGETILCQPISDLNGFQKITVPSGGSLKLEKN